MSRVQSQNNLQKNIKESIELKNKNDEGENKQVILELYISVEKTHNSTLLLLVFSPSLLFSFKKKVFAQNHRSVTKHKIKIDFASFRKK